MRKMANLRMDRRRIFAVWRFTPLDEILYLTVFIIAFLLLAPPGAGVSHAADFRVVDNLTVPTGNTGIGTTAPVRSLDVVGTSGVGIGTSAAGDSLVTSTAGNVGGGSAAPLTKLDVAGTEEPGAAITRKAP